jgi:cation-transporting ATPase 13A3/4/5
MIGDGANDCVEYHFNSKAAIKQANVGVSFAQCDASYAAPFSSSG